MEHKEEIPLKWPDSWGRTLIDQRKKQAAWKKPLAFYRDKVLAELERVGVTNATISYNDASKERIDPGVALWYALKPTEDFSWQTALQIDIPMPSEDEVRHAFARIAGKHHPDQVANGSGGDTKIYLRLDEHRRKALAWIRQGAAPVLDNCIPYDKFVEKRHNLAAIHQILSAFRKLEKLGMPMILERVMSQSFKAALPGKGEAHVTPVT